MLAFPQKLVGEEPCGQQCGQQPVILTAGATLWIKSSVYAIALLPWADLPFSLAWLNSKPSTSNWLKSTATTGIISPIGDPTLQATASDKYGAIAAGAVRCLFEKVHGRMNEFPSDAEYQYVDLYHQNPT